MKDGKNFLYEFDYFRGLSIFLIVFCHIWGFIALNSSIKNILINPKHFYKYFLSYEEFFIFGATSFFVFISGFLFYYIFYKRGFDYKEFILKKCKNVLSPYLLIIIIFSFINICFLKVNLTLEYIFNCILFYSSYWYIPFIMVIFISSPLHIKFIETKLKYQIIYLSIAILYSTFTVRNNENPLLSVLFWSSFYLLGIFCSIYYDRIKKFDLITKSCFFITCILTSTFALAVNQGYAHIKYATVWDFHFSFNIIVIPKIFYLFSILFFCTFINNSNKYNLLKWVLKILSKYSFPTFFLHPIFIFFMHLYKEKIRIFLVNLSFIELHFLALSTTIIIFIISISIAYVVKKITKRYSRMIIGA